MGVGRKMANYYISAVHKENEIIKTVKTSTYYTQYGLGTTTEKTRDEVISDIDSGKNICTICKKSSGYWKPGEHVITEAIDDAEYIKTGTNGIKSDGLDNIAKY